jgi:hypothetical protein
LGNEGGPVGAAPENGSSCLAACRASAVPVGGEGRSVGGEPVGTPEKAGGPGGEKPVGDPLGSGRKGLSWRRPSSKGAAAAPAARTVTLVRNFMLKDWRFFVRKEC